MRITVTDLFVMIEHTTKKIIDSIVRNNPFWEHFLCLEGIIKLNADGVYYFELDDNNSLPIVNGNEELLNRGRRKYHGFLNYRDQDGFGDHKPARTERVHFNKGSIDFVFRIIEDDKVEEYSMKNRIKHKMDIFEHLQNIWSANRRKVKVGIICSKKGCAYNDIMCGLRLNDIFNIDDFYELHPLYTNFDLHDKEKKEIKKHDNSKALSKLKENFLDNLKEIEAGDDDIVIISRGGGTNSDDGYGILEDGEIKAFIANMTKLTICAVGHVNDSRSEKSFHNVFDFDAKAPGLAGVRLREWLLAFKTIPENLRE